MTETENKYAKAVIYAIKSPNTNKFYIGSTIRPINIRFSDHKSKSNNTSSYIIIDAGESYIEILEYYPCNNRKELEKREVELIKEHKNNIVNLFVAGRTKKQWLSDNKDKYDEYYKQHYQDNKIKILNNNKQYRLNNKDKIKKYNTTDYKCECGSIFKIVELARHNRTLKHIAYLKTKEEATSIVI